MSEWQNHSFENRIRQILARVKHKSNTPHHFGRPFISAYQIAIEFNRLYPLVAIAMNLEVGGTGTNRKSSLSQYIARQLSINIKAGKITDIEGRFFSNYLTKDMIFNNNGVELKSSLAGTDEDLSIFRLIDGSESNLVNMD